MGNNKGAAGFGSFAVKQMLPVLGIVVAALAALWIVIQYFEVPEQVLSEQDQTIRESAAGVVADVHASKTGQSAETSHAKAAAAAGDTQVKKKAEGGQAAATPPVPAATHATAAAKTPASSGQKEAVPAPSGKTTVSDHGAAPASDAKTAGGHGRALSKTYPVVGMAFVDAVIKPMDYELNKRFFGWRPNDIVEWTDNVNNFQLGVLEVTRRTSRTRESIVSMETLPSSTSSRRGRMKRSGGVKVHRTLSPASTL